MSDTNLSDRTAIHDLFTRYCCALDDGEVETVVDCFTQDAALKSPVIDLRGSAAIRAFAGRFAAQRAAGTQFRHFSRAFSCEGEECHSQATAVKWEVSQPATVASRTLPASAGGHCCFCRGCTFR